MAILPFRTSPFSRIKVEERSTLASTRPACNPSFTLNNPEPLGGQKGGCSDTSETIARQGKFATSLNDCGKRLKRG
jgi:hypothetical protein